MIRFRFLVPLIGLLLCQTAFAVMPKTSKHKVFQVSNHDLLKDGYFVSNFTIGKLIHQGNFGLGTFNNTNGAMVFIDDNLYRCQASEKTPGRAVRASYSDMTPSAQVGYFYATQVMKLKQADNYAALNKMLLAEIKDKPMPFAFRIEGQFKQLTLRTLREKNPPYENIKAAMADQQVYTVKNVRGTLVGYWFPSSLNNLAFPGLHLHFISASRDVCGHVVEVSLEQAKAYIQSIDTIEMYIPKFSKTAKQS